MAKHEHVGAAPKTTLSADIDAAALSISVASGTGYPTGAVGPFAIVIDRGLATEEKLLCDSRSGNTITVNASGRGYDGTTPQIHASGAYVEHPLTAAKVQELDNYVHTAMTGDVTSAAGSKVTTIAADAVGYDELIGATGTAKFLARATSGAGNWEEITAAQALALLALDSTDLSDFNEAVQDVLGAQSTLGGSGLGITYDDAGNTVTVIVNVDGSTIEINSDALRVKAGGIGASHLAADAVTSAKIADGAVDSLEYLAADLLTLNFEAMAPAAERTTNFGGWAQWPTTEPVSFSLTKKLATSRILAIATGAAFGDTSTEALIGVEVDGITTTIGSVSITTGNVMQPVVCLGVLTGVDAGANTFTLRASVTDGTLKTSTLNRWCLVLLELP